MIITPVMFSSGGFETFFFFHSAVSRQVERQFGCRCFDWLWVPQHLKHLSCLRRASVFTRQLTDRINHRSVETRRRILINCKLLISWKKYGKMRPDAHMTSHGVCCLTPGTLCSITFVAWLSDWLTDQLIHVKKSMIEMFQPQLSLFWLCWEKKKKKFCFVHM